MDFKCLSKCFSFSICLFFCFIFPLRPFRSCVDQSNGVFEVNSRFTVGFWINSSANCLLFNLHDMETQHTTAKQNRGKWITVNAQAEKDLILTFTAPDMMAFVFPGHQGLEICTFSSTRTHIFFSSSSYFPHYPMCRALLCTCNFYHL